MSRELKVGRVYNCSTVRYKRKAQKRYQNDDARETSTLKSLEE